MNATPSDRARGRRQAKRSASGVLGTLRSDTSGNALAIMAAFLVPLAALAGSAVDMSRAYLVRARLQQACDAGVLAGRKLMKVTTGTTLDATAYSPANPSATPTHTAAKAFFDNNFPNSATGPGWMQTTNVSFTPSRLSDGQVTATATATMPMAIMGMFGFTETTQTVTCNARLDVGDTDIMFVLDTTGSMACVTASGCSTITTYTREDGSTGWYRVELANSKIAALRTAVSTFYTTLAANAPTTAHIRYGFVPYASSVNVGAIIMDNSAPATGMPVNPGNPNYIVSNWTYQSRELAADQNSSTVPTKDNSNNYSVTAAPSSANSVYYQGDVIYGSTPTGQPVSLPNTAPDGTPAANNREGCLKQETRRSGSIDYARGSWPTTGTLVRTFPVWSSSACKTYAWNVKPLWRYKPVTFSTSGYRSSLKGTAVTDPSKITGATSKWTGCVEERDTTASTSFSYSSLPKDLEPDTAPSTTDDTTKWRPMWPDVVYYRNSTSTVLNSGSSTSPYGDTSNDGGGENYTSANQSFNIQANYYACGKAAQRLKTMTLAEVQTYVGAAGDFRALGYTYHDIGMVWGLRLISPDGIWKADTAAWPGNNPPNRFIIFMSDGILQTDNDSYGTHGIERLDKRVTGSTLSNNTANHNARFQAVCTAAKNKNITVFVVAFDTALSDDMSDCATPGFAYTASNAAGLNTAFQNIALQVAKLRLSQ